MNDLPMPNKKKDISAFFNRRWLEITDVIDYDPEWEILESAPLQKIRTQRGEIPCGFHNAYKDPVLNQLSIGQVVKSMDDHGRRFIFVMTRLGLVMAYVSSIKPNGDSVTVKSFSAVVSAGFVSNPTFYPRYASELAEIIGSPLTIGIKRGTQVQDPRIFRNIGQWMEGSLRMLTDPSYRPRNVKRASEDGSEW
jgi:hypothetical protein